MLSIFATNDNDHQSFQSMAYSSYPLFCLCCCHKHRSRSSSSYVFAKAHVCRKVISLKNLFRLFSNKNKRIQRSKKYTHSTQKQHIQNLPSCITIIVNYCSTAHLHDGTFTSILTLLLIFKLTLHNKDKRM